MLTYILYWGVYPQWTKQFDNVSQAVNEARKYISSKDASWKEFQLIQQIPVIIGPSNPAQGKAGL